MYSNIITDMGSVVIVLLPFLMSRELELEETNIEDKY
jgi:hypothetical protein